MLTAFDWLSVRAKEALHKRYQEEEEGVPLLSLLWNIVGKRLAGSVLKGLDGQMLAGKYSAEVL